MYFFSYITYTISRIKTIFTNRSQSEQPVIFADRETNVTFDLRNKLTLIDKVSGYHSDRFVQAKQLKRNHRILQRVGRRT